jgi:glycolate oxidase iron-sulfur subunit
VQTRLPPRQRARPEVAQVDEILRKCVHCGFCNATCPTYALLGDELDGPRGRIYQIKSWLEEDRAPTVSDATHIDRCLSCLACVTTCPSGVDYMHLVDFARGEIEASPARNRIERWGRALLGRMVTSARLFRWALRGARLARPLARYAPARIRAMLELLPDRVCAPDAKMVARSKAATRRRVALVRGCAQDELRPQINDAAARVLERLGCEVFNVSSATCCGAVAHHLGQRERARRIATRTASTLHELVARHGVDTVTCSASGCGTMLKDYGHVLHDVAGMESRADAVASRTRDLGELIRDLGGVPADVSRAPDGLRIALHSPCSIYHGQRLGDLVSPLLAASGYSVQTLGEPHLCCGSAGVYNILQPQLARELRDR